MKFESITSKVLTLNWLRRYHRCMFDLPLQPGGQSSVSLDSVSALSLVSISPFSRWDEIAEKVKPSERPVVLNR